MHTLLAKFVLASLLVSHAPEYRIPYGSIFPLGNNQGNFCTAFSINEREGYWATADHCVEGEHDLLLGGEPAEIVMENFEADLAVLRGPRTTALKVGEDLPYSKTKIYKYGYGHGWFTAWASEGEIAGWILPGTFLGHWVLVFDLALIGGDSGGPVMTYDNTVISVSELYFTGGQRDFFIEHGVKEPSGGIDTPTLHTVLCPFLPGNIVCPNPPDVEDEQGDAVPSSGN